MELFLCRCADDGELGWTVNPLPSGLGSSNLSTGTNAYLAQLAEQGFRKAQVGSSRLSVGAMER